MNGSSKNKTYLAISTFANNLIQNPQVRIPPEVLKEMLITEPDVNSFITIAQSKIYERHKVNEEEITQAVDYYKSVDVEIANISEEIANNLELAYVGQFEIDNTPLPQMLTPDLAMRTLIEIYEAGKYFTYKHFTLLKRKNIPFNQSSPEFVEAMRRLKIEEDFAKDQIFARVGLDKFEENPMVLINRARQIYSRESLEFNQKIFDIEWRNQKFLEEIEDDQLPQDVIDRMLAKFGPID